MLPPDARARQGRYPYSFTKSSARPAFWSQQCLRNLRRSRLRGPSKLDAKVAYDSAIDEKKYLPETWQAQKDSMW